MCNRTILSIEQSLIVTLIGGTCVKLTSLCCNRSRNAGERLLVFMSSVSLKFFKCGRNLQYDKRG